MIANSQIGSNGCVLYDGTCGICTHFIYRRAKFFERYGFSVAASQEDWVRAIETTPVDQLKAEIRLLLPDGTILRGPAVYRTIFRAIWYFYPFYLLSKVPIISQVFDAGYYWIAARRKKLSRVCGLKPRFEE